MVSLLSVSSYLPMLTSSNRLSSLNSHKNDSQQNVQDPCNRDSPISSSRVPTEQNPIFNAVLPFTHDTSVSNQSITDAFKFIRPLGHGASSKVEEVFHIATGMRLARKTISIRTWKESVHKYLALEAKALQQLRHDHIIRFIESYRQNDSLSLLLSPVADSNLAVYLDRLDVGIDAPKIHLRGFYNCLVSALHHIHESSFAHGDIKPTNILITQGNVPKVLLCDFGASRSYSDFKSAPSDPRPFTRRFCAPEAVRPSSRGRRADIFSLGCVFLEMAARLWLHKQQELQRFQTTFRRARTYYEEIPQALYWLIQMKRQANMSDKSVLVAISEMLAIDPSSRPTAKDLSWIFPPRPC